MGLIWVWNQSELEGLIITAWPSAVNYKIKLKAGRFIAASLLRTQFTLYMYIDSASTDAPMLGQLIAPYTSQLRSHRTLWYFPI